MVPLERRPFPSIAKLKTTEPARRNGPPKEFDGMIFLPDARNIKEALIPEDNARRPITNGSG